MKIHNFVEDSKEQYYRTVFCRRCGQVAWHYDSGIEANTKLQANIKECVELGENQDIKQEVFSGDR